MFYTYVHKVIPKHLTLYKFRNLLQEAYKKFFMYCLIAHIFSDFVACKLAEIILLNLVACVEPLGSYTYSVIIYE